MSTTRRVGRPRKVAPDFDGDPREQILSAAARLFEQAGFAGTSTREIAAAAGLTQGSIFHYFPTKADILAELLDRTTEPALSYVADLQNLDVSTTQRLCLLNYLDALALCSGPYNEAALMFLPEAREPMFDDYWRKRQVLVDSYQEVIRAGVESGEFEDDDPARLNTLVCALTESSVRWFDRARESPRETAELVARTVLKIVLRERVDTEAIVSTTVAEYGDTFPGIVPVTTALPDAR
ncbi:TetR/AcrR family transcriptional regulator [Streptomyces sp. NPDC001663]|uniref:TetR/AcrR family transcriptional regulator n=1 Tax=Streptomyces sp. NPDC001663 TaxID=3364597 RepID=UPI00368BC64B